MSDDVEQNEPNESTTEESTLESQIHEVLNAPSTIAYPKRISEESLDKLKTREKEIPRLVAAGCTPYQIAEQTGLPITHVRSFIEDFLSKYINLSRILPGAEMFRVRQKDILAAGQLAALESAFNPKKLEKAGFLATITGVEKLHKMERLERNKSTENISHGFGMLPAKPDDVSS